MKWTSRRAILGSLLLTAVAALMVHHFIGGPVNDPIPRLLAML